MDYINIFRTLFGILLFLSIVVTVLISTYVTSVFGTFSKRTVFIQTMVIMFSVGLFISAELYKKDNDEINKIDSDKHNTENEKNKIKYIYFTIPIVLLILFNVYYYLLLGGILYAEKKPKSIKSLSMGQKIKGLANITNFGSFVKERRRVSLYLSDKQRPKSAVTNKDKNKV